MKDFQVVHFSPGRLRVRLPQVVQDPSFGPQLEEMLSSIDGINTVTTSSLTGSVLVEYEPSQLDIASLLTLGKMLNLVPEDVSAPHEFTSAPGSVVAQVERIGETLGGVIEQGSRIATQALNPRFAIPAAAINAVARSVGAGVSPTAAAVWVLGSLLLGPRPQR